MACALTTGFALDCRDGVGGIKEIYITELANIAGATLTAGVITALTGAVAKMQTYALDKEFASATEKINNNDANGTVFYDQTVKLKLKKLTTVKRNELRLAVQNLLGVMILDRNGVYWMLGYENGLTLSGDGVTGNGMGDFNGYDLTLVGKEGQPMYEVDGTLALTLLS